MKKKKLGKVRLGSRTRRRTLLLSRKARIRKGPSRKAGRGLALRTGKTKRGLLPRRKRRLRRRLVRRVQVIQPP
ncbi:hypothetical protein, partial [Paenibacillus sonchi]|uniref:hypothetical protein n=1 Tax=Paenibacillus sonchi TaxID=373687 RepID=UPI000585B1EF